MQKISIEKLKIIKQWAEQYLYKSTSPDYLPYAFDDIFQVILPAEKRKVPNGPFKYQPITENNIISNKILHLQIGDDYKRFFDFVHVCSIFKQWSNALTEVANQPEVLGAHWDLLDDDNQQHLKTIANWLDAVIASCKNPVDGSDLNAQEISKLKSSLEILKRSYELLDNKTTKSFIFS